MSERGQQIIRLLKKLHRVWATGASQKSLHEFFQGILEESSKHDLGTQEGFLKDENLEKLFNAGNTWEA